MPLHRMYGPTPTATPLDVVYSFVPYDAIGCIGEAFTVTVTVNPEPEVTDQMHYYL
jgi:hypothetical protein